MSLIEVIQLIGYSMGAALPLWLSMLLAKQRRSLSASERVLLALAVTIGLWHVSNLLITIHALLGLDASRWSFALRLADTLAVSSITLSYSLLLHVHLHLWANARARTLTRFERARVYLSYLPLLFLIVSYKHIWSGAYAAMLEKLSFFVLPFGLWATYVLGLIAITDLMIARASDTASERRLMQTLAVSFIAIGILLLSVYALGVGQGTALGLYLQTLAKLGSLLPTALIAYYIYRYRYLELIIKESLIVASFAAVVLVVYLYGIRTIETWFTSHYNLRAGAVEALLILGFALLAAPLRGWLEKRFQKLFAREAALYRDVVARMGMQARRLQQLPELLRFVEERTAHELNLRRVSFYLSAQKALASDNVNENGNGAKKEEKEQEMQEGTWTFEGDDEALRCNGFDGLSRIDPAKREDKFNWEERVLAHAIEHGLGSIEDSSLLREHNFEIAYPLRREDQTFGLMLIDGAIEGLTPDVRAVLEVLAGQVAIAIEDCQLVEANVNLERRVAQGERLAALGQMAATVAHEVKNPLSAIKSIAQVMREDERLASEYQRDLDLIVGETDRLSRSVTQLLSFARHAPPRSASSHADKLLHSLVELFRAEAVEREIVLDMRVETSCVLDGAQATAIRDALSNLLLNALQATPARRRILLEAREISDGLLFAVTDEGPGINAELQTRIWEPFFTTKQRGTGLGLAIVRKRMEEIGGRARLAQAEVGTGARFELLVPRAEAHLKVYQPEG